MLKRQHPDPQRTLGLPKETNKGIGNNDTVGREMEQREAEGCEPTWVLWTGLCRMWTEGKARESFGQDGI